MMCYQIKLSTINLIQSFLVSFVNIHLKITICSFHVLCSLSKSSSVCVYIYKYKEVFSGGGVVSVYCMYDRYLQYLWATKSTKRVIKSLLHLFTQQYLSINRLGYILLWNCHSNVLKFSLKCAHGWRP